MFEKVNPAHPDKLCDRIAGAIVDLAYRHNDNTHIAVEVLNAGYNVTVVVETDTALSHEAIERTVRRISPEAVHVVIQIRPQDSHLHDNQRSVIRCGDNGIFRGCPITTEQKQLTDYMGEEYEKNPTDGKAIICNGEITHCQSHDPRTGKIGGIRYNPLGAWTGGPSVDTGATNRKLGSDMGDAVTGGGLHGKDLSKADVTLNIIAHKRAQALLEPVEICCSIGDEYVEVCGEYIHYMDLVAEAKEYIDSVGGFEAFSEWGLIRPNK